MLNMFFNFKIPPLPPPREKIWILQRFNEFLPSTQTIYAIRESSFWIMFFLEWREENSFCGSFVLTTRGNYVVDSHNLTGHFSPKSHLNSFPVPPRKILAPEIIYSLNGYNFSAKEKKEWEREKSVYIWRDR